MSRINITEEQQEELYRFLTQPERRQKNILKALEEMAELSEVLLKSLTKNEDNAPPLSKVVEETGDVIFRLGIMIRQMKIEEETFERLEEKEARVYEWYQEQLTKIEDNE
jgi:NTP pyrophosphatase (non-canonical NTP hydrolase)